MRFADSGFRCNRVVRLRFQDLLQAIGGAVL